MTTTALTVVVCRWLAAGFYGYYIGQPCFDGVLRELSCGWRELEKTFRLFRYFVVSCRDGLLVSSFVCVVV